MLTYHQLASVSAASTWVGAATASTALISYLDAKLGLRNDVENLMSRRAAFAGLEKAGKVPLSGLATHTHPSPSPYTRSSMTEHRQNDLWGIGRSLKADQFPIDLERRLSIYYFLEDIVKKKGDAEAIWSHSECLSWNQLYARVHQYAQWFLSQNVKPGDLVVMYMANSPDFICVWFGLMAIGAAPALINTNLASRALVHCVNIAEARLILADGDDEMLVRLQSVRSDLEASGHEVVILRHVRDQILGSKPIRPADELRRNIGIDSPMALAYTSGTTGLPKAIVFPVLIIILTATVVSLRHVLERVDLAVMIVLPNKLAEKKRVSPTQGKPREAV